MDIQEAIAILDPETSRDTLWLYEDEKSRKNAVDMACIIAVKALKKRIAGKPIMHSDIGICPDCHSILLGHGRYCYVCGKKIYREGVDND